MTSLQEKTMALDLNRRAFAFAEHRRFQEALDLLDKALNLWPTFATAHNERGYVLAKLGRYDCAIDAAKSAIRYAPRNAKHHTNLIAYEKEALRRAKSFEEVQVVGNDLKERIGELIRRFPKHTSAYAQMAEILALLGEPQSKWEHYLGLAGEAFYKARKMSSGPRVREQKVAESLIGSTQRCYRAAEKWDVDPPDPFAREDATDKITYD